MDDRSSRILDELPLGVWVGTPDAVVSYANRAFNEILGMAAVEGSRVDDIPRTYRVFDRTGNPYPVERLPFSRVLATGESVVVEDMVIHRADGARVPLRAFGHPVRDGAGHISHVIVVVSDISREARAEADRATLETRLKLAVDHAPIAVFSIDPDGIITLSEGAGLAALGVRSGELVGKSVFDLYRDHPTIPGYIRRGLAGESFYYTVQVGNAVYDSWLTPVWGEDGRVVCVLGVSHDMSELRRLQAAAIQNDRIVALGTLAASVAHEINNPLTYVLAHLEGIRRTIQRQITALSTLGDLPAAAVLRVAASDLQEQLAPAQEGVQRIATIVRDLSSFSRPDDTHSRRILVRPVVESVLKLTRKEVELRARLVLELDARAAVVANENRLAQVLLNLLMNAQQSLPEGRADQHEVTVTLRGEGDRVIIEVSDTGPGVPATERERVFEPFVTRRPTGEGTGLGLFVCRHIVRGLGGDISVQDRAAGGAIFRVELPAAGPAPVETPAPTLPPPTARRPARVLVIDDEPQVTRALCRRLADAGFKAESVGDAASASAILLTEAPFDLIFCDLIMKGMTGMDLAELLADQAPHRLAHMVFMSGGAFTERAASFIATHRGAFVEKPFDIVGETLRRLAAR